jgi:hypothetical protein
MPNSPNTRETALGFGLGVGSAKSVEFSKIEMKILDRNTSYLAIHYVVVVQGLRKGDFLVLQRIV